MRRLPCPLLATVLLVILASLVVLASPRQQTIHLEASEVLVLDGETVHCLGNIQLQENARLELRNVHLILTPERPEDDWCGLWMDGASQVVLENVTLDGPAEGLWIAAAGRAHLSIDHLSGRFSVEGEGSAVVELAASDPVELRVRQQARVSARDATVDWVVDLGFFDPGTHLVSDLTPDAEIDRLLLDEASGFPFTLELQDCYVGGWSVHVSDAADVTIRDSALERIVLRLARPQGTIAELAPRTYEHFVLPDDLPLRTDVRLALENTELLDHWAVELYGSAELSVERCELAEIAMTDGSFNVEILDTQLGGLRCIRGMGEVRFDGAHIHGGVEFEHALWLTLAGNVTFSPEAIVERLVASTVARTIDIELVAEDGAPAAGQGVTIAGPDGRMRELVADANGIVRWDLLLDDASRDAVYTLRIDPGDRPIERFLGPLTSSPLRLEFLRASVDPTTLYVGTPSALDTLYPRTTPLRGSVYEALLALDGNGRPMPLLCPVVPAVGNGGIVVREDGGCDIVLAIRPEVTFHSGSPLTPEDVAYSLVAAMVEDQGPWRLDVVDAVTGTPDLPALIDAEGVEAAMQRIADAVRVEENAVILRLERPFSGVWSFLATTPIVERAWMSARGGWDGSLAGLDARRTFDPGIGFTATDANGTGPFRLETHDAAEREVVLARNDDYWGAAPSVARVRLLLERGPAELLELLRSEALDVVSQLGDPTLPDGRHLRDALEGIATVRPARETLLPGIHFALFNREIVPTEPFALAPSGSFDEAWAPVDLFSDLDVRLGFLHVFDWEAFRRQAAADAWLVTPIHTVVTAFISPDAGVPVDYPYDPRLAWQHLASAWGGELAATGFTVDACFNGGNARRRMFTTVLADSLAAIDPRFHLGVYDPDFNTVVDALFEDTLPLVVLGLAEGADPLVLPHAFLHSDGLVPSLAAPVLYDELLDRAAWTLDLDVRDDYLEQIRDEATDDPIGFVWRAMTLHIEQEWVTPVTLEPYFALGQIPGFDLSKVTKRLAE